MITRINYSTFPLFCFRVWHFLHWTLPIAVPLKFFDPHNFLKKTLRTKPHVHGKAWEAKERTSLPQTWAAVSTPGIQALSNMRGACKGWNDDRDIQSNHGLDRRFFAPHFHLLLGSNDHSSMKYTHDSDLTERPWEKPGRRSRRFRFHTSKTDTRENSIKVFLIPCEYPL